MANNWASGLLKALSATDETLIDGRVSEVAGAGVTAIAPSTMTAVVPAVRCERRVMCTVHSSMSGLELILIG